MIERFNPLPFDSITTKENYTLIEDLKIYSQALEEKNLISAKVKSGSLKTFIRLAYIFDYYALEYKIGNQDENWMALLNNLKDILDNHTQVRWLGEKTSYGGRFYYGFTDYYFPKEVKKQIFAEYKKIKKNVNTEYKEVVK